MKQKLQEMSTFDTGELPYEKPFALGTSKYDMLTDVYVSYGLANVVLWKIFRIDYADDED